MQEALDDYATQDPAAHWTDLTLQDVDLTDPLAIAHPPPTT